jgi:hypothetical protein
MSILYAILSCGEGLTAMDTYHEYFICIIYFDYYCYRPRHKFAVTFPHQVVCRPDEGHNIYNCSISNLKKHGLEVFFVVSLLTYMVC